MEFKIQRDALYSELVILRKYLSKLVPALGNFLFEADDATQTLTLTASDTQNTVIVTLPATVTSKGSWILSAAILFGAIKNYPSEEVEFKHDAASNQVLMKCKKKKVFVPCYSSQSFINITAFKEDAVLDMTSEDLAAIIKSTTFAKLGKATGQQDYKFEGIHLKVKQGNATFICSDRVRIAIGRHVFNNPIDTELLISAKSLEDFVGSIDAGQQVKIKVNTTINKVVVSVGNKMLYPAVFLEKYPDVARYIPTPQSTITVKRMDLISSLEIANLVHQYVDLEAAGTDLKINNKGSGTGSYDEVLVANVSQPSQVSLRCQYFLDGLKAITGDEVELLIESDKKPVILRPKQKTDYAYLLTPVV